MLDVLLIIAAALVLLGIAALVWPLRVRFQAWPGTTRLDIRYLLLRVTLDFRSGDSRVRFAGVTVASSKAEHDKPGTKEPVRKTRKQRPSAAEEPAKTGPSRREQGRILWEHRSLLRRVLIQAVRLVGRLIRSWTIDEAKVALVLGLSNPASTGIAAGCIYAALPALQLSLPRWRIAFMPQFTRANVAIDADITLRLIPLEPMYHIVRMLGTLPWRGLWKLKAAFQQS